jgi:hypothetical protein
MILTGVVVAVVSWRAHIMFLRVAETAAAADPSCARRLIYRIDRALRVARAHFLGLGHWWRDELRVGHADAMFTRNQYLLWHALYASDKWQLAHHALGLTDDDVAVKESTCVSLQFDSDSD